MHIIIKGKHDHFGKTRSEQETNMRKEWGHTMTDEQFDKLKYVEKKVKNRSGSSKNFIRLNDLDYIN